MSLADRRVFQLRKQVTFRRIPAFCSLWEGCFLCVNGPVAYPIVLAEVGRIWYNADNGAYSCFSWISSVIDAAKTKRHSI
jgi:hypothetical protein